MDNAEEDPAIACLSLYSCLHMYTFPRRARYYYETYITHFDKLPEQIITRCKKAYLFTIPLKSRIGFCHTEDAYLAVVNAAKHFDRVKGWTLLIAGGPVLQRLFEDMLCVAFGTSGLPPLPRHRFTT